MSIDKAANKSTASKEEQLAVKQQIVRDFISNDWNTEVDKLQQSVILDSLPCLQSLKSLIQVRENRFLFKFLPLMCRLYPEVSFTMEYKKNVIFINFSNVNVPYTEMKILLTMIQDRTIVNGATERENTIPFCLLSGLSVTFLMSNNNIKVVFC